MGRQQYTFEYTFVSKPELLYNYLSTPSGLATWFAEEVNIQGDQFSFIWEGSDEKAEVIRRKPNKLIVFKWIERGEDETLTFELKKDELTGDTALLISDYDDSAELEEAKLMWDSAIELLKNTIGG